MTGQTVLISGASVAGPVLAYWLRRSGMVPTVVERTPKLRLGTGGHAVDLFGAAIEVVERMGLLEEIHAASTNTETIRVMRGERVSAEVSLDRLVAGMAEGRHVEIMRGELARILYESVADDVEHIFGDEITSLRDDGDGVDVTFAQATPRRFDLVVGADGLHSGVRRLAFGKTSQFGHHLGGYLAVFSYPDPGLEPGVIYNYNAPGSAVVTYPVWQSGEARATFIFRGPAGMVPDRDDMAVQRQLLAQTFSTASSPVRRLVDQAQEAADFYLDSITQIRMKSWSTGRVTLVGDAGYSPGPAIGGGTSLAAIGSYTLAHHLGQASNGQHAAAFRAYADDMRDLVETSRGMGPAIMRQCDSSCPLPAFKPQSQDHSCVWYWPHRWAYVEN